MDRLAKLAKALNASIKGEEVCHGSCPLHTEEEVLVEIRRHHSGRLSLRCSRGCSQEELLKAIQFSFEDLLAPSESVDARSGLVFSQASAIKPKRTNYLVDKLLPLGAITVLGSRPNEGKSTLSCAIAAAVTSGRPWQDGSNPACGIGSVVFLTAEEAVAETTVPRLAEMGANLDRVEFLTWALTEKKSPRDSLTFFSLDQHFDQLERALTLRPNVRLLVIDPFESYLGNLNPNKNPEVRKALARLAVMAENLNIAILLVQHLNKRTEGAPLNFMAGSVAIAAAARSVLLLGRTSGDPDTRYLLQIKNNLGPQSQPLSFQITQTTVEGVEVGTISWNEETPEIDPEDLLFAWRNGASSRSPSKRERCRLWLVDRLPHGEKVKGTTVLAEAEEAGFHQRLTREEFEDLKGERKWMKGPDGERASFWWLDSPHRHANNLEEASEG